MSTAWVGKKVEILCVTGDTRSPFRGWIVAQNNDSVTLAFEAREGEASLGVIEERTLPRPWRGIPPGQIASTRQPTWWKLLPDSSTANLPPIASAESIFSEEEDAGVLDMEKKADFRLLLELY